MERLWIYISGLYAIGLGIYHIMFWKIFKWKTDLQNVHFINRGVMQIMNLCLIYVFMFIMGFITLFYSKELKETSLGHAILFTFAGFWFIRTIEQIIFFPREYLKYLSSWIFIITFLVGGLINLLAVLI